MQLALDFDVLSTISRRAAAGDRRHRTNAHRRNLRPAARAAVSTSGASAVRRRRLCDFPAPAHQPRRSALPAARAPTTSTSCNGDARAELAASREVAAHAVQWRFQNDRHALRRSSPDLPLLRQIPLERDRPEAKSGRGRRRRHMPYTRPSSTDQQHILPRRTLSGWHGFASRNRGAKCAVRRGCL